LTGTGIRAINERIIVIFPFGRPPARLLATRQGAAQQLLMT
jgi:hypothetical protein